LPPASSSDECGDNEDADYRYEASRRRVPQRRTPVDITPRSILRVVHDVVGGVWTPHEDERLRVGVALFGRAWQAVASYVQSRSATQCLTRWTQSVDPSINRNRWTTADDERLSQLVDVAMRSDVGRQRWAWIALQLNNGRTGRQCRERYVSHNIHVNHAPWTAAEDALIVDMQSHSGNAWSVIAAALNTGRTDYQIRKRYLQIKRYYNKQSDSDSKPS
jgi:hypothetical protein